MKWPSEILLLISIPISMGFECYKNDGINLETRAVYCDPVQQPYCLKANVYDGRVIRDCASAQQCPQGIGCAPITYEQDQTTDFVCCCMSALCNSSTNNFIQFFTVISLLFTVILFNSFLY